MTNALSNMFGRRKRLSSESETDDEESGDSESQYRGEVMPPPPPLTLKRICIKPGFAVFLLFDYFIRACCCFPYNV